eukprot:TRINITY_DN62189_c0_g1_i1.p1 TRINITY_DN62189_c0_g1~~TRINITY_DN62189_c0_g1_i1.p1  ORF type:complete len:725 (+),score=122.32 TRINITY_DN62189_c0_g1_i1:38-2212(+)
MWMLDGWTHSQEVATGAKANQVRPGATTAGGYVDEVTAATQLPTRAHQSSGPGQGDDPAAVMTGFQASFHSRFVEISADGLQATYVGSKQDDSYALCGGVMGNAPLPVFAQGRYFEVQILRTVGGHDDGLSIGVTMTDPQAAMDVPVPEAMDAIPDTWLFGFDGAWFNPWQRELISIGWKPARLQKQDVVGFLATPEGAAIVHVNGQVVVDEPNANIPDDDLFAVIDLLGCADEVRLLVGEAPPELPEPQAPTSVRKGTSRPSPAKMQGFSSKNIGCFVELSENCMSARHVATHRHELSGGVIGDGPLEVQSDGSVYFQVKLTEVKEGMKDGLTLGVSSASPQEMPPMPSTIGCLGKMSWSMGYDGAMFDGGKGCWAEVGWCCRDLRVQDEVGLLVTKHGQMSIFVNGQFKAEGPSGIPVDLPLYALADLMGNAAGVQLQLDAKLVEVKPEMDGWCRTRLGQLVELSPDGCTAIRKGRPDSEYHGGLVGDGPLRVLEECWFYELRVNSISGGMAVGVTTCSPNMIKHEMPETMEELEPSWLLGFYGEEWDGAQRVWGPAEFEPIHLQVDDRVGVVVNFKGELQVYVNDAAVAQATFTLPCDGPFFAIVDLLGPMTVVTWLKHARPPVLQQVLPKVVPSLSEVPFAPSERSTGASSADSRIETALGCRRQRHSTTCVIHRSSHRRASVIAVSTRPSKEKLRPSDVTGTRTPVSVRAGRDAARSLS